MRILYLHQYFATRRDSTGTRSYEFARRLVEAGHEVHVVTSDRQPRGGRVQSYETVEDGIHVHWMPVPYANHMPYAERIRAFLRFAWRSTRASLALDSDVIFATSTPLTIAIPAVATSKLRRIPMVFEVRDLWPDIPIAVGALRNPVLIWAARALEWTAYHAAEHIIALSPGMAEGVARRGIPRERITVLPNSSDLDLFDVPASRGEEVRRRLGLAAGQPLILYAGTLGLINGVGYIVDIAAEMQRICPEARFLLVGDGVERDAVYEKARQKGVLDANLFMWEPVAKAEMPGVLSAATVATSFVIPLPVLGHNSANKFFDALAAGRPMVINHGGWQADLLHEHGAGLALPPDDAPAAARLLADFVSDPERVQAAGKAARHLAETHFDRDVIARQLEAILRKAARG